MKGLGSLVCDVSLRFVTFPYGVLGQVWYLIVSIPDLSSYFARNHDSTHRGEGGARAQSIQ